MERMEAEQISKNLCKEAVRWVGRTGIVENLFEVRSVHDIQLGEQSYLKLVIGVYDSFATLT
jgi:hypothetical protein